MFFQSSQAADSFIFEGTTLTIPFESLEWKKTGQKEKTNYQTTFAIRNRAAYDQDIVLGFTKSGRIQVEVISGTDTQQLVTGSLLKLRERSYPSNSNAVRFTMRKDSLYIIRLLNIPVYSLFKQGKIDITIQPTTRFEQQDTARLFWQGIFLGTIFVMALYNLFIFYGVRDVSYLYYVLSIAGLGLYLGFYYGFGIEYLWPDFPRWDTFCYTIIVPFTNMARLLFTRSYLSTTVHMPRLNRIIQVLMVACGGLMLIGIITFIGNVDILNAMVTVVGLIGTLVLILMLVAGLLAYYADHYEPARYFITANALLVAGAILFILRETGYAQDNFYTRYIVQVGFIIQVIVFALGLASRYNSTRVELAQQRIEKERLALESEREKKAMIEQQKQELQLQIEQQTQDLKMQNITLEETISQLEESREKLSQLNSVKDKLFSIISHDLRNPLATMQSFLKLITQHHEKLNEEEKKKMIREAQGSLDYLNELLYNLLQWSKSQMHMLEFKPEWLAVKTVIEKNIRLLYLQAYMKQVQIETFFDDQLKIFADKEMLDFIIRNLVSNAIKFSHKNSSIQIRVLQMNKNILISVSDEGVGMSTTTIEQLLQANLGNSRRGTAKERGTGLGLLISKEFINRHGGILKIEQRKGKGSIFTVELPCL